MEKIIEEMPFTDIATKRILQDLVKKKEAYRQANRNTLKSLLFLFGIVAAMLLNCYLLLMEQQEDSIFDAYQLLIQNSLNSYLLICFIAVGCWYISIKGLSEKLDAEFQKFRSEVVDRSIHFWKEDSWKNRHEIFMIMKDTYGINLFYESK